MAFFNLVRQPDRVERLAEVIDKLVRWGGREGGEGEGERREGGGMGKDIEDRKQGGVRLWWAGGEEGGRLQV